MTCICGVHMYVAEGVITVIVVVSLSFSTHCGCLEVAQCSWDVHTHAVDAVTAVCDSIWPTVEMNIL